MRIISRRTLQEYFAKHSTAETPLKSWLYEAKAASWKSPADVKADYASASILNGDRVVFNIGGNNYRLVVRIHYGAQVIYIKFVGTHAEYDKIDAETVDHGD